MVWSRCRRIRARWRRSTGWATSSKAQDRALRQRASDAVAEEYRTLVTKASDAETDPQRRTVDRLRRELRSIEGRDHFGSKEQDRAQRAVERLATLQDAQAEAAR